MHKSTPTKGWAADYFQCYGPAYFKGHMDNTRSCNHALTDAEVQCIYTIERAL